ncbi:MAG: YihY/virulence factor BrkB family protein [Cytophagaceae bacterium]|nr:YihY/virulence factor BrkB family protein [Cytophagaceae bacterium]
MKPLQTQHWIVILKNWLHRWQLDGPAVTMYLVLRILWDKLMRFDIDQRASAVAFNFTLAVFPTLIFLFTLIAYVPIRNFDLQIMNFLEEVMPGGIFRDAEPTIRDIVSRKRGDVLSLGFLLAVYASTSGMMALMRAFNMTDHTTEKRSFLKARLIGVALTFVMTSILFFAIAVLIVGRILVDTFFSYSPDFTYYTIQWLGYVTVFVVFFVAVSLIYQWGPALPQRWRFVNVGSVVASILLILITNAFSFYLSNFAAYNRLYGAVGTLIALMVWLYLVSLVLILGFEINTSLEAAGSKYPIRTRATRKPDHKPDL